MGERQVHAGTNYGVVSTGDQAHISPRVYHAPDGGVRPAEMVPCPAATVHLGAGVQASGLFVGREEELGQLDAVLVSGAGVVTQALTGLGGIGKSTLVREYARRHRTGFNPIWWIPAEDSAAIEAGLAGLARRLQPELALLPDEAAAGWARTWLSAHEGWLLLLDNVTDPADVADLIADLPGGRFLLTSRTTVGWHGIAVATGLGVLEDDQATELMERIAGPALMDGAARLCQLLGNLPLAIEQAAAYMQQNQVTAAVFASRLATDGQVLAWNPDGHDAERTIARIWQISLHKIAARHGDLPGRLLHTLAWYAPDDIPVAVLHHLDGINEQHADEALGRLAAYALITRTGDTLAVHRLVQVAIRTFPAGAGPGQHSDIAARALLHALPDEKPNDPAGWPTWRRLIPHIETLAVHTHPESDDRDTATLLHQAARFLYEQGAINQATVLAERAHTGRVRLLGPDHPDTLQSRNDIAGAYREAGDLGRAIQLFEQNLDDRIRVLGPDHPGTMQSRNNLAGAYKEAGDLGRAIPLFEQNLGDAVRVLGQDHPEALTCRHNLASAYQNAGDLARAIPLYEQNLDDTVRVLGPAHPDTLSSRHNLAYAYEHARDLGRAISLYEQNLDNRVRVLGPDHPDTLRSRNNLAGAYKEAGDLGRAIPLFEQNLDDRVRVLGPEHPATLRSRNNLAVAYRSANDLARAIPLYEQALDDSLRVLGPDHPLTKLIRRNLEVASSAAAEEH
jgi:tetratricopeptide (TPR) repeat protein